MDIYGVSRPGREYRHSLRYYASQKIIYYYILYSQVICDHIVSFSLTFRINESIFEK